MERLTCWLSSEERGLIKQLAAEYGTSQNYVVRVIVRQFFDLERGDTQMAWQRVTAQGPPRIIGPNGTDA